MIEAKSRIDYKDYCHYIFVALMKKIIFKIFLVVSALVVVVVGVNIILSIVNNSELKFINYLPLIFLASFYLFYFGLYFGMSRKQYKRAKNAFSTETSYLFYNNKFVIAEAGTTTGLNVFYESIKEVLETKKRVYFFIADDKSYMMRKDRFVKGDIKELRKTLTEHCKKARLKLKKEYI